MRQTRKNRKRKPARQNATNSTKGKQYEDFALAYLQRHGLELIDRNYHCHCGEIDLIMRDAETLVFVEVKYRKHRGFGASVEQVTWSKQQKLLKSALIYLAHQRSWQNSPWRFDVVGINGSGDDHSIQWLQNALEYG